MGKQWSRQQGLVKRLHRKRGPSLPASEVTPDEWAQGKDCPEYVPEEQTNEMQKIFEGRER